jgi:hypothetical protein
MFVDLDQSLLLTSIQKFEETGAASFSLLLISEFRRMRVHDCYDFSGVDDTRIYFSVFSFKKLVLSSRKSLEFIEEEDEFTRI